MTSAQLQAVFNSILLPTLSATAVIAALGYGLTFAMERKRVKGTVGFVIAFSALGVTTGFAAGNSREPVVGAMLPAMLTLVSGLLTYVFGKEALKDWRSLIPSCITVVVVGGLVGLALGASSRSAHDEFDRNYARFLLRYERIDLETEKAKYLAQLEIWKQRQLAGATPDGAPSTPVGKAD